MAIYSQITTKLLQELISFNLSPSIGTRHLVYSKESSKDNNNWLSSCLTFGVSEFVRQLLKSISNQYRILLDDKNGLGGR
jgi:hypothetical protein